MTDEAGDVERLCVASPRYITHALFFATALDASLLIEGSLTESFSPPIILIYSMFPHVVSTILLYSPPPPPSPLPSPPPPPPLPLPLLSPPPPPPPPLSLPLLSLISLSPHLPISSPPSPPPPPPTHHHPSPPPSPSLSIPPLSNPYPTLSSSSSPTLPPPPSLHSPPLTPLPLPPPPSPRRGNCRSGGLEFRTHRAQGTEVKLRRRVEMVSVPIRVRERVLVLGSRF